MKRGDKFEVHIAGQTVAQAEVYEVGEGQVTLRIPATEVVMATATHIAPPVVNTPERSTETIITGVDRAGNQSEVAPVSVDETTHIEPGTVNTGAPVVEAPTSEPPAPVAAETPEPVNPQVLPGAEVVPSADVVDTGESQSNVD